MQAGSAHRQATALPSGYAAGAESRPRRPLHRITIVTRMPIAGMLPKHAGGKVSDVSLFLEICMPLGKNFFRSRSQFAHAPRYSVAETDAAPVPVRRTIFAASADLMLKSMARCGVCADLAFANFPVAIVSWIVTQFFVGCAAYAEAMYPSIAYQPENEEAEGCDRSRNGTPARVNADQSPGLAPDLRDLSRFAVDEGARSPFPVAGRSHRVASRSDATAKIVRLNVMRRAPSGRLVSITTIVTGWLSRRRRPSGGHQSIVDLRNHERRVRRGTGLSRYGVE
jgi:hypothetical protein